MKPITQKNYSEKFDFLMKDEYNEEYFRIQKYKLLILNIDNQ